MGVIEANLAALAVAAIYYGYRDLYLPQLRKQQVLRERVAYMLWTAAQRIH